MKEKEILNKLQELNSKFEYLLNQSRYNDAFIFAEQAVEISKKLGENHLIYSQNLNNLALSYYYLGNYEQAENLYAKALKITENKLSKNHPSYATGIHNLAVLYRDLGAYQKAESYFIQALDILKKTLGEEHLLYATYLNNFATLYYWMGDYDKAKIFYKQSMLIRKNLVGQNHHDYASSLYQHAELYTAMGFYEKAEPLYQEAMCIVKENLGEDNPEFAACINSLAKFYKLMGAYEKAELLYQQSLEIRKNALGENHPYYATSLNDLAELYRLMGLYKKAESLHQNALITWAKSLGQAHPHYALSLNNLAALYYSMRAYEKAEPLYKKALKITRKVKGQNHSDYAIITSNLAVLYRDLGAYQKGEFHFIKALDILKTTLGEEHPNYALSLYNFALLYFLNNQTITGLNLMKKASIIDDKTIGQVFAIGSEEERLKYLSTIRPQVDKYVSVIFQFFPRSITEIKDILALILKRKAIAAEALAAQRDAILGGKYPHLREKFYHLKVLRMQIAKKTLAGPGKEGSADHHRYLAEWNIEKEQLETELARQIPEIKLEEKLRTADRSVIAHTLPPGSVLLEFFRFDEFNFTAIPAKGQNPWKPARYCAFVMHSGDPDNIEMIDLGEAEQIDRFIANYKSKLTREGRGEIEFLDQNQPQIFQSGLITRLFGKKTQLEEEAPSRDIGAIPDHDYNEEILREYGLKLYDELFAPLHDALGESSRLIIAPDSQISTIPFEVIPAPEGGYLIDKYNIHYVGVGRDVLRFTTTIPGKPEKPLIMASPDFDLRAGKGKKESDEVLPGRRSRDFSRGRKRFDRLPGTKVEGDEIGSLLNTKPLLEQEALESRIKAASSPSILHIATHGFFQSDQELADQKLRIQTGMFGDTGTQRFLGGNIENPLLRSGLALAGVNTWLANGNLPPEAEDGILTAEDVTGLDLTNTDIAVLSACNTGMGDVKVGEGVFGLRRAFALAGAKTLVMSLWKVPDKATQELMVDFYRRILAGTPKADALRESQLELRKNYPDPRDWGAFICQGDPGVLADLG